MASSSTSAFRRNKFHPPPLPIPAPDAPLDPETASLLLAISLQREEISLLNSSQKGKQRAGTETSLSLALSLLSADLATADQLAHDRKLAESHARAVATDYTLLATFAEQETNAARDRRIAEEFNASGADRLREQWADGQRRRAADDDDLDSILTDAEEGGEALNQSAFLAQQATAEHHFSTKLCMTCTDRFPVSETITIRPCGHHYCHTCCVRLFIIAVKDETLYPPKCCGVIFDQDLVMGLMQPRDAERFDEARVEYEAQDRVYCSNVKCGKFLPPGVGGGRMAVPGADTKRCGSCGMETCIHCLGNAHGMEECPKDEALQKVLETGMRSGWKRCPKCRAMVQRTAGCNHMTCKCGSQWCFTCIKLWKTCQH